MQWAAQRRSVSELRSMQGFGENLRRWGLLESFGTVGDCFDNAVMEAFWGRLQTELLNTKKWSTTLELTAAMADHIDNFHNGERRHSYLGNISPIEYEKLWADIQPYGMTPVK